MRGGRLAGALVVTATLSACASAAPERSATGPRPPAASSRAEASGWASTSAGAAATVEPAVFPPLLFQTTRPVPAVRDLYLPEPVTPYGRVEIPRLGLDAATFEGLTLTVIDHGPAHWPGSAAPGELGNAVYAGHRVSKSRPFHRLDELRPGDQIFATGPHGRYEYRVVELLVVTPDDLWIADPTAVGAITLFACHPKGSARQRIVARGMLVGPA